MFSMLQLSLSVINVLKDSNSVPLDGFASKIFTSSILIVSSRGPLLSAVKKFMIIFLPTYSEGTSKLNQHSVPAAIEAGTMLLERFLPPSATTTILPLNPVLLNLK